MRWLAPGWCLLGGRAASLFQSSSSSPGTTAPRPPVLFVRSVGAKGSGSYEAGGSQRARRRRCWTGSGDETPFPAPGSARPAVVVWHVESWTRPGSVDMDRTRRSTEFTLFGEQLLSEKQRCQALITLGHHRPNRTNFGPWNSSSGE
jgi:hypothetical protein